MGAARYKPYPAYKPSGVEWLGDFPVGWTVKPIGSVADVIDPQPDHRAPSLNENGTGFPYIGIRDIKSDGTLNFETARPVDESAVAKQEASFQIANDDIVFCKVGTLGLPRKIYPHGRFALSATLVLIKVSTRMSAQFAVYALESKTTLAQTDLQASGSTRKALGIRDIRKFKIFYPPLAEQTKIAAFLDYETGKIDALIAKQERLIALLEEKRQAVISHAVTKGLDPNAPLRPSGIDWLGDVPEHWEVKRLRNIGRCQNGINIGAEFFGTGSPFISYGDVYRNSVLPISVDGLVRSTASDKKNYSARRGDVFFTRTSETIDEIGFASTCLNDLTDSTFAGFLIRFRPVEDNLIPEYSRFYFRMNLLRFFFVKEMNLITRASLSQDLLKQLPILIPPKQDQNEIAAYLEEKHRIFEQLTANAMSAITLLKERRTALISAAVTGKIDVRDWHPSQSNPDENLEMTT